MAQSSAHNTQPSSALVIDALDHEISRVEEEIRAKMVHLWNLRRQRNACLPVARIPPEILAEIFLYLRDARIQGLDGECSYLAEPHWLSVLRVSRTWREITLTTPQLWTCVDLLTDNVESISRSGALPLRIFLRSGGEQPELEVLNTMCTHRGKICALSISASSSVLRMCLPSLVSSATDTLSVLEITASHGSFHAPDKSICNLSLPRLQQLTLECYLFDLGCTLLAGSVQSLRKLVLKQCNTQIWMESRGRPALEPIFDVLESLRALEDLWIVKSLHGWKYTDSLPELRLPSLKHFHIDDCQDAGMVFLKTLRISGTCHADLHINDFRLVSEECPNIATFFTSVTHPLHLTTFSNSISVRVLERTLTLKHLGSWEKTQRVYDMIGAQISAHTAHIYLHLEPAITGNVLRALCGKATAVAREVTLQGTTLGAVAECLKDPTGFLPRLERLHLEEYDTEAAYDAVVHKLNEALIQRDIYGRFGGV